MHFYNANLFSDVLGKVAAGLIISLVLAVCAYIKRLILRTRLRECLEDDKFTPEAFKKQVLDNRDPYIFPDCQDRNPAALSLDDHRKPIFAEIDSLLGESMRTRFTLILADTGMGKSEFLLRYYATHWSSKRRSKRFHAVFLPLNGSELFDAIKKMEPNARSGTVLLLDALDEDRNASEDFARRFHDLVDLAGSFYAIVVTCRTQFVAENSLISQPIDLRPPYGPIPLGKEFDRRVKKIYLSPFSNDQIRRYLSAKFPYWVDPFLRWRAAQIARHLKDLMPRPLLLTYIRYLDGGPKRYKYSYQAYETIVDKWLGREIQKRMLTTDKEELLRFSEKFAGILLKSGKDRVPAHKLESLARSFSVKLVPGELRERSLLHDDGERNWKFAHRSIMEYLAVSATSKLTDGRRWNKVPWTDLMRTFAREMLISGECKQLRGADLRGLDLKGADLSHVDLRHANLGDADLARARFAHAKLDYVNFQGACIDGTIFDGANLDHVQGLAR